MRFYIHHGCPGFGKNYGRRLLKEKLGVPFIDFDWIRDMHLNAGWTNASEVEENMSIENLTFLLKNYAGHGYKHVVVGGFSEKMLAGLKEYKSLVVTLYLADDEVIKNRVLTNTRDSGFRDYGKAIVLNKQLRDELHFPNEIKIDNTNQTPDETADEIVGLIYPKP